MKVYGSICLCHKRIHTRCNWKEIQDISCKKSVFRKGEKECILNWLNYCKKTIYFASDIQKLEETQYIFCDAGTKNKRLEVRVTNSNSYSLINEIKIMCHNKFVIANGNYVLQSKHSVNYAELLGIFLSLIYCKNNKNINFIFSDSLTCIFFWLYGIYNSNSISKETKVLIIKTTNLMKEMKNIKVIYINRKLNKSDISIGNYVENNKK